MSFVNQITLPQDVLDRVARVMDYHITTKHTHDSVHRHPHALDAVNKPYEFRVFEMLRRPSLPTGLLDVPAQHARLMEKGFAALPGAVPEPPPQDLKTLATWLHFADGIASRKRRVTETVFTRTVASDGNTFPCEIYVAAFAVEGLEPGLYHYSPREFALRKLRDGPETLARLTRGRPDLAFLKTVPLAMLVSTIFCRSTWRFGKRGYRSAVHDAGYLMQNLVTVATALGVQTMTRLILNDTATRELIGVPVDADFAQAEAVQALVVWADRAHKPMSLPLPASTGPVRRLMPPIERDRLAERSDAVRLDPHDAPGLRCTRRCGARSSSTADRSLAAAPGCCHDRRDDRRRRQAGRRAAAKGPPDPRRHDPFRQSPGRPRGVLHHQSAGLPRRNVFPAPSRRPARRTGPAVLDDPRQGSTGSRPASGTTIRRPINGLTCVSAVSAGRRPTSRWSSSRSAAALPPASVQPTCTTSCRSPGRISTAWHFSRPAW